VVRFKGSKIWGGKNNAFYILLLPIFFVFLQNEKNPICKPDLHRKQETQAVQQSSNHRGRQYVQAFTDY